MLYKCVCVLVHIFPYFDISVIRQILIKLRKKNSRANGDNHKAGTFNLLLLNFITTIMQGREYLKSRNMMERVHMENPDVNGRIILKLILEKKGGMFWNGLICFTIRCKRKNVCKCGNKNSFTTIR